MENKKVINIIITIIAALLGMIWYYYLFIFIDDFKLKTLFTISWLLSFCIILLSFICYTCSFTKRKSIKSNKQKKEKIIAIISAYNEDPETLYLAIKALLNQTISISTIHVVDDGSTKPIEPFQHEKVIWYRQENAGKRYAQKCVVDTLKRHHADYIITVDSDSIVEKHAIEILMEKFYENENINAVTGFVLTRNYKKNIITRIADLNIGISCTIARPIRSLFGALETTSGALSIYKKDILFDNMDDYVIAGTYSDDRQLCFYSLLTGDVVSSSEAVVYSDMPETWQRTLNQRLRWGKGSWKFFPSQVRQLSAKKLFFPVFSMLQILIVPVFFYAIIKNILFQNYQFVLVYFVIRICMRMLEATMYIAGRPRISLLDKIMTIVFVAPLEYLFSTFVLVYIKFKALFFLNEDKWRTR